MAPWVNVWPGIDVPFSRAWSSYRLANLLEPWSVRDAALITGMAPGYVGLWQINAEVPASVAPGPAVPLVIAVPSSSGSITSNTVTIAVE